MEASEAALSSSFSSLQPDRFIFEEERMQPENACVLSDSSNEATPVEAPNDPQTARLNVLLAVTGSVAAIKIPEIIEELHAEGRKRSTCVDLKLIATKDACHFLKSFPLNVIRDEDDWRSWNQKGDPVLHIELRRWADVLAIAPLSANSLAKISQGLCDSLLTCVARAWDFKKPFVVFPAMNALMWKHPLSAQQLDLLRSFGVKVVEPVEKTLACGDTGPGALPPPQCVAAEIFLAAFAAYAPDAGESEAQHRRV
ncbi:hypothetical protein NCLIV_017870 [Neospora caninum Liverpool]|uniref:Homo-oligomeric flavin-containing Cys decarboxylase (HFCD superfamily),putative n=1 Tax=Neospora caninum (strain Liverpool) TaxID=572307 RepID=F0VE52_NEOCL|nr:hypothetical protein NCLIV_017870 [Neospora caninum Liverpool]CBZ51995.1 hypothetical protein NCLIV_017870 [Neospora caninum Liverpool]CEL65956.1 TPA: Homo-oligomeric flavin-containing Cys decarboxylase (HFCD superfamily),putative [Neospora caninum Liverpool]|eukprot:XP_003882028.1 hypothetical protein NCLIV_017870 [Neospora caninum Liverpool]